MAGKKIQLELPEELFAQLETVAGALGIPDPAEAAVIGVAEWVAQQQIGDGRSRPGTKVLHKRGAG